MTTEDCGCNKKKNNQEENENLSERGLQRRGFINYLLGITSIAFIVSALSPLKMLIPPKAVKKESGDLDNTLKYARSEGTWYSEKAGEDVMAADFEVGSGASVIWRGSIPAILIKLDQDRVNTVVDLEQGFAAFCSRCTHLCCIANWKRDRPDLDMIFCLCHDGILDPYNIVEEEDEHGNLYYGALVVGGPVPRPYPMIPVEIIDGKLMGIPSRLELYDYC